MRATHLFFLIALLLSLVLSETIYLSANGSDDNGDGSEDKPYQTFAKVFNSSEDATDSLEIYVYPGTYGGANNTAFNHTGPLTISWLQNATATEGAATAVTIDCTSASGVACFSSNTSITINGLDDNENPQIIFNDCGTCIVVDNSASSDKNDDYLIDISGVTFDRVSQAAVVGDTLHTVTITDSIFNDNQGGDGLSLVYLVNVEDDIKISNTNFTSLSKNALTIVNTTQTELDDCNFTNSKVAITGVDQKDSQVVIDDNTFVDGPGVADYTVVLQTGTFTVKDSKFVTTQTGSIKASLSDTTSIINTSFNSAEAQNGGALYFENVTTVTVSENCLFTANVATFYGGAIYLVNSEAHFDTSNFTGNVAVDGAAIGCLGNETTVYYDNTTVFFSGNINNGGNGTDIQNTCKVEIQTFQSSLVVSSADDGGSNAWIWILVSIAILVIILIIVAAVGFVIYQRKRQSYTRMD